MGPTTKTSASSKTWTHVTIDLRSDAIQVGWRRQRSRVERVFTDFEFLRKSGINLSNGELYGMLKVVVADPAVCLRSLVESGKHLPELSAYSAPPNQRKYVEAIEQSDMVFGLSPAGTGKTYLAVAAVSPALMAKKVSRIILVRPAALQAGERLGFLSWQPPGEG